MDESLLECSQAMKRLNQKITRQRALVMKCLEASPSSKDELNRQIAALQDLQRQQIELEVSLLEQERKSNGQPAEEPPTIVLPPVVNDDNDRLSRISEPTRNGDAETRRPSDLLEQSSSICNSTMSLSNSVTRSHLRSRQSNDEDAKSRQDAARGPQTRGYSSVYLTVR